MPRRALARRFTAAATTVVLSAGLVPAMLLAGAGGAHADTAAEPETVVPAGTRWYPQDETLYAAGSDGYLARHEDGTLHWVNEADGSEQPEPADGQFGVNHSVHITGSSAPATVTLTDFATGRSTSFPLPAGQEYGRAFSADEDAVLTFAYAADGRTLTGLHVLRTTDGQVTDTPVSGLPAGVSGLPFVSALNGNLAVVRVQSPAWHTYLLDLGSASAREIFAGLPGIDLETVVIGDSRIVAAPSSTTDALSVPLSDPTATPVRTPAPSPVDSGADGTGPVPVPVGDSIVFVRTPLAQHSHPALQSVPVGGGTAVTLLPESGSSYALAPDGSMLVTGGTGPDDWGVRRIAAGGTVSTVRTLPPPPAAPIHGLSYSGGRLVYATDTSPRTPLLWRDVTPGADPAVGPAGTLWNDGDMYLRSCATGVSCLPLRGRGDGTVVFTNPFSYDIVAPVPTATSALYDAQVGADDTTVTDAAGRYALVNTPSTGEQSVIDFEQSHGGDVALTRPITASALWGTTLWVPGATAGSVRPYSMVTRSYGAAVQTAATCASFTELQADGRRLYWSCGASAGVYDRSTGRNIAVPAGPALLGDGYLVRHDTASGSLLLTDFHTGTPVTSTLATGVPDSGIADDRDITWSVDTYGGGVAYADAGERIHVLPLADIPRSPLGVTAAGTPSGAGSPGTWQGRWDFSRPTGAWTLTVRNQAGRVLYSGSGSVRMGTEVTATWNLKDASGHAVPDGTYTTTLTAQPGDGQGPAASYASTVRVHNAPPAPRDYTDDGTGDLMALTSSGRLDLRPGTGTGAGTVGATYASGTGWPTTSTYVPIGDLNGDRCNDLLVRDSAGRLYRYDGGCDAALAPSRAHTYIGAGWGVYNLLTSPGDLTGDGRPDLVARDSGGDLYLYKGTSTGVFAPRVKIGAGWGVYNTVVGAQDLNGDGAGDLLARDYSGVLWRYDGDGKGGFRPRVRVGAGWNAYNALVGVGDLNGEGRADLLARDPAGYLWRYNGDGEGGFAARVRIGWGWQTYRSLF